ncbi:elongation factor tu GTP binding domain-containing protein [Ditylenchus destructor]|nr:elongation factor tu GTP binding domain-containing protein [Ditylenchus destructor]
MSRHRNVRNINIEEELEEDDDYDYYGKSMDEDDEPLTPGTSQFIYQRPTFGQTQQQTSTPKKPDNSFSEDDERYYEGNHRDEVFPIDDVLSPPKKKQTPKNSQQKQSTPQKKASFTIGESKKNQSSILPPNVEQLRISGSKPQRTNSKSPARTSAVSSTLTPNTSFQRLTPLEMALASTLTITARKRPVNAKPSINLAVLGGVDDKAMHKYKQEATRAGKASFAYAWILDEGEEERNRGVTMDIARAHFQSEKRAYFVLDSPGHKDFIPNMITGASQADAAILVINATTGEFETGFDQGGQTREHALLLRSLGVSKIVVAINKLDTVNWSQERFNEIKQALSGFLHKQAGFDSVEYVPVSGLLGANIMSTPPKDHPLLEWYKGPSLIQALDNLPAPTHALDEGLLRIVVNDVLRSSGNSVTLSGKIECGFVETGDKLFVMPEANPVTVKAISSESDTTTSSAVASQASEVHFSGEQVFLTITGTFEPDSINSGHILCRGGIKELLVPTNHFSAKIVVFDITMPILMGTRAELFAHSIRVPCTITKLVSEMSKTKKDVIKKNPRVLTKNSSALVEVRTDLPINIEPHTKCKALSRFTLRSNNQTIAAGVVDKTL